MGIWTTLMPLVAGELLEDLEDSPRFFRSFRVYVGIPAFVIVTWLFERLIFGRRRRYPVIRRTRGARSADQAWRDRADTTLRAEERQRQVDDEDGR